MFTFNLVVRHLNQFVVAIDSAEREVYTDKEFQDLLFAAVTYYGVNRMKMANKFKIGKGTISKWCNGKSSPHPMVQPVIIAWIRDEVINLAVSLSKTS